LVAFLRTFLAVIFAILFLAFVPLVLLVGVALLGETGPRDDSWLTVRLDGELLEHYGPPTLRELVHAPPSCLMEVTENLEKAAVDDRIAGVLFRLEPFGAGLGKLDEIRDGIRRVQRAGKPVYAYASFLTDEGVYLASECDSLFLFPKGKVYLLGRGSAAEHLKGALEKLDVHEQFHATGEYKSMVELYTVTESSPESMENRRWIMEDLAAAFDETVGANRSLSAEDLAGLRDTAILNAPDAVAEGLADDTLWFDELEDRLRGHHRAWRTVSSQDYADVDRGEVGLNGRAAVAVVHAQGFVASSGEDRWDGMWGLTLGPDRVIEDIQQAQDDDNVRAIILRWDTGGGAIDGSQRIMRAVARARAEKPVVVSIADVAASGGYMMSHPANSIVCAANGITGSIGSVIGKLNVRGLYEKLGITFTDVSVAPNAFLFSGLHDWTPEQWQAIGEDNWRTYTEWVEDIAADRGLSFDEVDAASRGQVWTGRQALERNLVDSLGGFREALDEARRLADLPEDAPVRLLHYPEPRNPVDLLVSGDFRLAAASDLAREIRRVLVPRLALPGTFALEPFRGR
jgi:protease-4